MDGLIPLLFSAAKKKKQKGPARSFIQLGGKSNQVDLGFGYRRSRSGFQSPTFEESFRRQSAGIEFESRSVKGVDLSSKLKEMGSAGKKSSKW